MNVPLLREVLTNPDEFLSNAQLKSLALEILELVPMNGIEAGALDPEEIMAVVLRAAVGTTSVNEVTTKTSDTPNRKTVIDWLHTLENPVMLDAVNDILALVAMMVLDRGGSRTVSIYFMDNPFHGYPENEDEFRRMESP